MLKGVSILFILIHFFQAFYAPDAPSYSEQQPVSFITASEKETTGQTKHTTPATSQQQPVNDFEKSESGIENDFIHRFYPFTLHSYSAASGGSAIGKASTRIKDQLYSEIHTPPPERRFIL